MQGNKVKLKFSWRETSWPTQYVLQFPFDCVYDLFKVMINIVKKYFLCQTGLLVHAQIINHHLTQFSQAQCWSKPKLAFHTTEIYFNKTVLPFISHSISNPYHMTVLIYNNKYNAFLLISFVEFLESRHFSITGRVIHSNQNTFDILCVICNLRAHCNC